MTKSHFHLRPKGVRQNSVMIAACTAMLGLVFHCPQIFAEEASFKDFPYVIYCQFQGVDHAFYFSKLDAEGRAVYITPDRQAGIITLNGVAQRVGGEQSGTCLDKTLDDLRSAGQAYDLPR